ncbi:MAG: efflux RND transporter permease subunit, partial [Planctomycetota bacterium]
MNPAVWMYRNGYLLWLTIAVVLMAGGSAFLNLPREEDPRIVQRGASVLTLLPGSSAERVEALVTEVLEREIREVDEIKTIESTSRAGVSRISIELKDAVTAGQNVQIFSEVRDRVNDARALLPPEASEPVFDDRMGAVAFTLLVGVTWVGESSPDDRSPATGLNGGVGGSASQATALRRQGDDGARGPALGVMDRLSRELEDRLRNVGGTELVRRYGEPTEQVLVSVDGERLAELGLTVEDVAARLRGADTKVPTGRVRGSGSDLVVEVAGDLETLERVRSVPIVEGNGEGPTKLVVRVGDVAEVRRGWEQPVVEVGLSAGRRTVFVGARLGEGQQVGEWAARAREVVADFAAEVGGAVEVETVFDQSRYTEERLGELGLNLVLGAGVIVVVVVLTMGLRSALIVGTALPLVSALTLFGVLLNGGSLHQMSIFGMIIALGLLIDNAIVVVDEVGKELRGGKTQEAAVDHAVRHLAGPLFASTLTTVLAFAPIVLLPGSGGDFIGYIGISVAFAITASYGVSLTVVAALAGRFLSARQGAGGGGGSCGTASGGAVVCVDADDGVGVCADCVAAGEWGGL